MSEYTHICICCKKRYEGPRRHCLIASCHYHWSNEGGKERCGAGIVSLAEYEKGKAVTDQVRFAQIIPYGQWGLYALDSDGIVWRGIPNENDGIVWSVVGNPDNVSEKTS